MSKTGAVGRVKRLQKCDTCDTWLRRGWKVFKWWPPKEEQGLYPKVWVCRTCFTKLINGVIRPERLPSADELRATVTQLDLRTPVEPPSGVVPPSKKSPMSARR